MKYNDVINKLYDNQDLKYKDFSSKIILCNNILGVRTPILKKIAKDVAHSDYLDYFLKNKHSFYEEDLLHGLILGYIDTDFDNLILLIDNFLPFINNWAICDQTAANLKLFKKNSDKGFKKIKEYISSSNTWINRFGYVLLIDHYINDNYIDYIFDLCNSYQDEYYVKMSIAWLISICYIKYKDKTMNYLTNNNLDKWTFNKAIQKIIESKRISLNEKVILRKMKKK